MSDDCRRYGRLSNHLYRFIRDIAAIEAADWGEREDIEMALRFIKRLERLHEKEEADREDMQAWQRECRRERRKERLAKKGADVVKLVPDGKGGGSAS